jgi:hypothetical protein
MKRVLLFLIHVICCDLFSQVSDTMLLSTKAENYIRFQYDNDFFSATDRYYTQGIHLTIIHPVIKYSPISYLLVRLKKASLHYYGFQIAQDCFTPKSIRYDSLNYLERPFAATFYVTHTQWSLMPQKKQALRTEIDLGILGPCAMCEEEQKAIHRSLVNIQPLGWENQLKTNYLINYNVQFEKGLFNRKQREIIGQTTLRTGTFYTDLSIGLTGRMGFFSPYFSNLGMDKNALFRKSNFQFYGILKGAVKAVAYNATLEGGLFNDQSVYTISSNRMARVVVEGMAGFVLTYKQIGLEYSKFYLSPEFREGLEHHWGKCVISYCF